MMDKRILKTGTLAVFATIGFALFVYRADEWIRGLQSGVPVFGQRTNTNDDPCAAPGNDTPTIQRTKVVPQLAFGSFDFGVSNYTTIIQVTNISELAQNIAATFYKDDGSALDNVVLTVGDSTIKNGVLPSTRIAKDAILVIRGGGNSSRGVLGWGKITACAGLSVSTFFEMRDGPTNAFLSRSAVAATSGNMSSFVIPRIRDASAGLDVAFAVVNTGTESATLKAELKDASGTTVASKDIVMRARSQQTGFVNEFFPQLNDGRSRMYQYLKFSSTSASFGAMALAIQGAMQTNFPVDVVQ